MPGRPFEKGRQKTGGRQKGVPLLEIRKDVAAKLSGLAFDPIERLVQIVRDPETSVDTKARICCELARYVHAQRKAVEFSGTGGNAIEVSMGGKELLMARIDALAVRLREGQPEGRAA